EAKTLTTALNVFEHFRPSLSEQHRLAPYVFLANIDPVLQLEVLEQIENPKLIACDSMNFWITGKPDELRTLLRQVDLLSLNEEEAYLLSGNRNIRGAIEQIHSLGPSVIVVKRGQYGSILSTNEGLFLSPAYPVNQIIDPTGAGDTFAGAMI